jgi:hypothetical protein
VNDTLHVRACALCLEKKGLKAKPLTAEEFVEELYAIHVPRVVTRPTLKSILIREKTDEGQKGGDRS